MTDLLIFQDMHYPRCVSDQHRVKAANSILAHIARATCAIAAYLSTGRAQIEGSHQKTARINSANEKTYNMSVTP